MRKWRNIRIEEVHRESGKVAVGLTADIKLGTRNFLDL